MTMAAPKATDVKKGISLLYETLQCPICLELMTAPVSTKCDHQFCKYCMMKLLDNSKQNRASCPVCKANITKRSLQESPGFQRLVVGLQDMIQAYEHDTRTNYFTGLFYPLKDKTQSEADHKGSSGDTRDADLDNEKHTDHLPHSHSSTIAAQNGFARLMAFEDSTPFTENEGLDSGLGGAPPTSDKKMSSGADNPEPVKSDVPLVVEEATSAHEESFGTCPSLSSIPDETEHRLSRKSSRKKQKKKSKILQQRKKKSVEKVAEWLMNVPTDGSLELEEPERNGEDSDSGSSASTIDIKQHMTEMTHQKEDRAKALEDQVFGAVYKRRSNKFFPAPPNSLAEPSASTDTQASESVSIISNENFLLPDDVTRQEHEMGEATNGADSDFFKEAGQTEPRQRTDASVEELNKSASAENRDKHDFVSPARTRKRTRSALQQVDSDLKEQESEVPDQKKPDRRKGRITKLDKSKPSRARKSLVLVEAQKGETCPNPRARSEEVQLQIESYPSSEDQDASAVRSTRRSRRLQVFAEEVQGGHRKSSLRATVPGKTSSVTKQSENPKSEALTDATPSRTGNKMEASKRNGCVYHQDLAEIESLSKPDEANKGTVGTASNAEPRSDVSPAHGVTVVPNSTSPNSADVVEPTLKSHTPANHPPNNPQLESSVRENDCEAESEEEQNDCEVDTEQLMKSFKATKRKSFHLGSVDVKKSCYTEKDGETDENRRDFAGENTQEAVRDTGKSTSIDLISPSVSPVQIEKTVSEKPDCLTVEAFSPQSSGSGPGSSSARCRNSLSSALPPHQEPKSDMESPRLSFVPQIVDSGLHFTPVEHEDVNQTTKCPDVKESQPKRADTTELFTESSLTPDGLIPAAVQNVYDASGEVSSNSSILRNQRRKRKAPMLESPSGSDTDASKEDLPSLAQILGTTSCPPAGCQDPGEGNATEGECDAAAAADPLSDASACPSPDCVSPSQGSVDLFGTPEECDVPVNVEVSMESSQFSSEVLVTQQKIEMQQELARLEKMMALVSKVLQEKEGGPSEDVPSETHQCRTASDPEPQRFPRRSQDPGQASDRKDLPDAHQDAHPRPPGAEKVAEPAPSKPDDIPESVQHAGLSAKAAAVSKTLTSPSASKTQKSGALSSDGQENKENNSPPRDDPKARLVLVSSGLASSQQTMVKKFAKRVGARVVSRVTPEVTHVVIGTDEQLVCERTLKYFLGIAGRKWVVSFQWISECFKQKKLLDESLFEVRGDTVNGPNHQGPSRARSTDDNNLLMKGYRICFQGSFTDMTTDEMEWMVELCGADVVKDPLLLEGKQKSHQLVIVQRRLEASPSRTHLSRNATVVTRGWLLDSVATYSLQDFANFGT